MPIKENDNAQLIWDLAIESIWKWNRLSRLKKAFIYITDQQGCDLYPLRAIRIDRSMILNKSIFSKKNDSIPSLDEYNLAYLIIEDIFLETRDNELLIPHRHACLFSSYVLKLLCRE